MHQNPEESQLDPHLIQKDVRLRIQDMFPAAVLVDPGELPAGNSGAPSGPDIAELLDPMGQSIPQMDTYLKRTVVDISQRQIPPLPAHMAIPPGDPPDVINDLYDDGIAQFQEETIAQPVNWPAKEPISWAKTQIPEFEEEYDVVYAQMLNNRQPPYWIIILIVILLLLIGAGAAYYFGLIP